MKKEEKEKILIKNRFNYRILIIIILSVSVLVWTNIFPLLEKDEKVEVKKTMVKTKPEKNIQKVEEETTIDSTSVLDTLKNNAESEVSEPVISDEVEDVQVEESSSSIKKNKKIKIDHENNPSNWSLVKQNGKDTSYYIIKNKITGTKLFNKYYTKKIGDKELKNFKNILAN